MKIFENVPGVKILEVRLEASPLVGVGTSTAGFVGKAPSTDIDDPPAGITPPVQFPDEAHLVTSADQFLAEYIGDTDPKKRTTSKSTPLSRAVLGFFANGGTRCYVYNLSAANPTPDAFAAALKAFEVIDEIAIIAVPGQPDVAVYNALKAQAETLGDRFAILDPPPMSALGDPPDPNDLTAVPADGGLRPTDSMYAAFYYPRIKVGPDLTRVDPAGVPIAADSDPEEEDISPVGHIAGAYALVDSTRGVHKAPANVALKLVLGVEHRLTDDQQDGLNRVGVNVLRNFSDGVVLWGARTLSNDSLWRYISTRRLVNYIEETLQEGLRWAVFEPNTLTLQKQIARSVRDFLDGVWRDGGLFGETSDQAYYVRFPPSFNTDAMRAQGKLTMEIGLRVTFPAEFIIIRIGLLTRDASAA
jgi:uncharacterized protein